MIWRVLQRVYAQPLYWMVTLIAGLLTVSAMLLLPNYSVLLSVLMSPVITVVSKAAFFASLYGSLATNFTLLAAISVILIAALFGINAALLLFYIRRARGKGAASITRTTTLSGALAAFLGIGCAACGSAVFAIALQLVGIGWILSYLPLHGAEFGLLGIGLLLLTTYSLAKKINDPIVCEI